MIGRFKLGFRPWKPPGAFLSWLTRILLPAQLRAEELGEHTRALNPVLSDAQIQEVLTQTRLWISAEIQALRRYVREVNTQPTQGDQHWHRYRERCNEAASTYRLRALQTLATAAAIHNCMIPSEEIEEMFALASTYKDWYVRRTQPVYSMPINTPLLRAEWFFKEYLLAWNQVQS